ncbi:unnamed protein product [Rotaria sp. Silwood2]|nr:unnamed protein product [Rotaria sp. Silwood2]CAF4217589.1 unnamed protein product [Rotaria sp. Silwood2]
MSELLPPPPAYDEIANTLTPKNPNPNWRAWYRNLIALKFTEQEADEYTKLFITNEIDISMIPELTDNILRTIGIDKAGHRIRILRLQNKGSSPTPPARPTNVAPQTAIVNKINHLYFIELNFSRFHDVLGIEM